MAERSGKVKEVERNYGVTGRNSSLSRLVVQLSPQATEPVFVTGNVVDSLQSIFGAALGLAGLLGKIITYDTATHASGVQELDYIIIN